MVDPNHPRISIVRQCRLVSIARSSFYYAGTGEGTVKLAFVERAGTRDRDLSSSQAAIVTASQIRKERPRSFR